MVTPSIGFTLRSSNGQPGKNKGLMHSSRAQNASKTRQLSTFQFFREASDVQRPRHCSRRERKTSICCGGRECKWRSQYVRAPHDRASHCWRRSRSRLREQVTIRQLCRCAACVHHAQTKCMECTLYHRFCTFCGLLLLYNRICGIRFSFCIQFMARVLNVRRLQNISVQGLYVFSRPDS